MTTNALLNSLTEALGDGFLPATLQSVMSGGLTLSGPNIDLSQAQSITGDLSSFSLTSLSSSVSTVRQSGLDGLSSLPGLDTLLQPINTALRFGEQLESADISGLLTRLQQAGESSNAALGLDGLDESIRSVADLQSDSGLASLLNLGSSLLPINLTDEAGKLLNRLDGLTVALKTIGSLMSLHAWFEKTYEVTANISGLLVSHELAAQRLRLLGWKHNTTLAAEISAVAADDSEAITRLHNQVYEFINDIHTFTASLQRGLGFGDAALARAGLDRLEEKVNTVSNALLATRLEGTEALTSGLRDWLTAHLPADFGSPAASMDAAISEIQGLADELVAQIQALPIERMAEPVTTAVGQLSTVAGELNNGLATAISTIRSVFEHIRQLIDSLNLASIAETISAALHPVVQVLEQLESFIETISTTIEATMGLATDAVKQIKLDIENGATEVAGAFAQVEAILAGLDMEALVNGMKAGIQAVVDGLHQIDLDPYFDTAVDAMDTVSSIIEAVPVALLPDDMEADLQNAVQPVKSINFDRDVRQILVQKLEEILDKVDADILGEIDRMFKEVIAFLQEHDPQEKLEELEQQYFDPMLAAIIAVNPEEILKPVTDVIDEVRDRILEIDVRGTVVDQIDGVFDDIIGYYDQCDPEPLLAPVVEEIDAFRTRIIELTGIDTWADQIDTLQQQLNTWLEAIDFAKVIDQIDGIYTSMLRSLGQDAGTTTVMGGFIAGLLSGSVSLRASSYGTVLRWISGAEDGVETVQGLIGGSLVNLRATLAQVDGLQPERVAAEAMPCYRAIKQAVNGLPPDHPLRLQLAAPLAACSPSDLLAPVIANLPAYRTQVDTVTRALERLATSGFSQITATGEALRQALAPLTDLKWKLIVLARRFGVDPVGKPLMVVVGEILAVLRPGTALEPFTGVVTALKAKIQELITGLVTPIKEAITQIEALLDTINIQLVSDELKAVHTQIRGELMAFRPSVLLAEPLDAFDSLRDGIGDFDPLAAVRTVIETFKTEVEDLLGPDSLLRPSVMFAGQLEQYQRILELAAELNVRDALEPVLAELEAIKEQLDTGLGETGEAFTRLQEALP